MGSPSCSSSGRVDMPIYYLDTSAVMKRYMPELGSEVVEELFDGPTESESLTTSYLTVLEANSAATRLLGGNVISRRDHRRILGQLSRDMRDRGVTVIPVRNELVEEAVTTIRAYSLRALDALHFTSAELAGRNSSDGQNLYMVSADREILEACQAHGILTLDPQAGDALSRLRTLR